MAQRPKFQLPDEPYTTPERADTGAPSKPPVPPSRQGKAQVTFFLDKVTKRQLDRICFDDPRASIQGLMIEAVNELLRLRGKTRSAA